jgi:hypothetical protein
MVATFNLYFGVVRRAAQEDANASGATLQATASLIAGTAAGTTEVAVIFRGSGGFIERREDAIAYGKLLTCFARIIAGRASAVLLFAGEASGSAVAANDNLAAFAQILPGRATGERNFTHDELFMIFAETA